MVGSTVKEQLENDLDLEMAAIPVLKIGEVGYENYLAQQIFNKE